MRCALHLWLLLSTLATLLSAACSTFPLTLDSCAVPGTSLDSYGVLLMLSASSQLVCVVPSTVVNSTLVIGSDYCQHFANGTVAQCESLSGNTFNIGAAGASYNNASTPSAILGSNPVWYQINSQALDAGNTSLFLPPNTIPNYPIGVITGGDNQNEGHLGLAPESQFLQAAYNNGIISQMGFGLDAGSQSIANQRPGKIVLGGYDRASMNELVPTAVYPIGTPSGSERDCPLQVKITQLTLRFPLSGGNFTEFNLTEAGIDVPACVEPYDNLFRFPPTILENIQQRTGWSPDTKADPSLLIAEPGLLYPPSIAFNGSLIIKLQGYDGQVEIPNYEMSQPLRGIAANGTRILNNNLTELKIFHEAPLLNTAILGKVFLSKVYLIVDYNQSQFRLAPSHPPESSFSDIVPLNSTSPQCSEGSNSTPKSNKLGGAIIAAIVISVLLLVAIIVLIVVIVFYKRSEPFKKRVHMLRPAWLRQRTHGDISTTEGILMTPQDAGNGEPTHTRGNEPPAPSTSSPAPAAPVTILQGQHPSQDSNSIPQVTTTGSQRPIRGRQPPHPEVY